MNIRKLIKNICFIVIGAVLITTIIIQIPNPLFNDVGSKDAWIGFFGAITGGALTLYGVWWSIDYQKNEKERDLSIRYLPIIKLTDSKCSKSIKEHNEYETEIDKDDEPYIKSIKKVVDCYIYCDFELINIGRGELYELNIESSIDEKSAIAGSNKKTYNSLFTDEKVKINLSFYLKNYNSFITQNIHEIIKVNIEYKDFIGKDHKNYLLIEIINHPPTITYDQDTNERIVENDNEIEIYLSALKRTTENIES